MCLSVDALAAQIGLEIVFCVTLNATHNVKTGDKNARGIHMLYSNGMSKDFGMFMDSNKEGNTTQWTDLEVKCWHFGGRHPCRQNLSLRVFLCASEEFCTTTRHSF